MDSEIKKSHRVELTDVQQRYLTETIDFLDRVRSNEYVYNTCKTIFGLGFTSKVKIDVYDYKYDDCEWTVFDSKVVKYFFNKEHNYHCVFCKLNGFVCRISDNIEHPDPEYCTLGPEIMDLEISVNGCPTVGGHNCKFCYKNNTNAAPINMTFDTFKKIVDSMPKCLTQIAFGITGVQTNPDFVKMMEYCREIGVIPNYTLSGADLNDELAKKTVELCGACAVSCYEGNKELCYNTIKRIHDLKNEMHINMHIVLSEDEVQLKHVWDVLNDIKDGKVVGLRNIVFLRIKPVGRASKMNVKIHLSTYEKVMKFCLDNNIGFGFDSCSAKSAIKALHNLGHGELEMCCEPCESSKFSSYCNVNGEYWNCSFCERNSIIEPIQLTDYSDFHEPWSKNQNILKMRFPKEPLNVNESCPVYHLDAED